MVPKLHISFNFFYHPIIRKAQRNLAYSLGKHVNMEDKSHDSKEQLSIMDLYMLLHILLSILNTT